MKQAIVHFREVRMSSGSLHDFSDEEIAAFGLLSHIANEVTSLSNLLSATHDHEASTNPIDFAKLAQHNVLLRTLVGSVFEAFEGISDLVAKRSGFREEFIEFFRENQPQLETLKQDRGYSLIRNVRNEMAFHYKFKTAKRNSETRLMDLDASMFISKMNGNCYFVLGEQLMFIQRLARFGQADASLRNPEELIEIMQNWTVRVVALFRNLHSKLFELVVDISGRTPRKTHYFVNENEVFEAHSDCLPVFVRKSV